MWHHSSFSLLFDKLRLSYSVESIHLRLDWIQSFEAPIWNWKNTKINFIQFFLRKTLHFRNCLSNLIVKFDRTIYCVDWSRPSCQFTIGALSRKGVDSDCIPSMYCPVCMWLSHSDCITICITVFITIYMTVLLSSFHYILLYAKFAVVSGLFAVLIYYQRSKGLIQ